MMPAILQNWCMCAKVGEIALHLLRVGATPNDRNSNTHADEVYEYNATHVEKALLQVLDLTWSYCCCASMLAVTHVLTGHLSLVQFVLLCGSAFLIHMTMHLLAPGLKRLVRKNPVTTGSAISVCLMFFTFIPILSGALNSETELMKHRMFLTSLPGFQAISTVFLLPFPVAAFVLGPMMFFYWILFHYTVGFLHLSVAGYGLALWAFSTYNALQCHKDKWATFQALRALERERQQLQATRATLYGMLHTVFDASCNCTLDGALVSCTQQMQQLLGESSQPVGAHLCDFVPSPAEMHRLRTFLDQAAQNEAQRAVTIQASLCHRTLASSGLAGTMDVEKDAHRADGCLKGVQFRPLEAKLFAIRLPPKTDQSSEELFVGIQEVPAAHSSEGRASSDGDGRPSLSARAQQPSDLCTMGADGTQAGLDLCVSQSGKGAQDSEAEFASVPQDGIEQQHYVNGELRKTQVESYGSSSGTIVQEVQPPYANRMQLVDRNAPRRRRPALLPNSSINTEQDKCREESIEHLFRMEPGHECDKESDASFALTVTTERTSSQMRAIPRTIPCEAGVQTESTFSCQSCPQCGSLPSGQEMSVEDRSVGIQTSCKTNQAMDAQFSARPPKPHRVTLNTRHRAIQEFRETPKQTVSQLIIKMAQMLNPKGKGCCFLHIASLVLLRNVSEILSMKCRHHIQPHHDWQCGVCLVVQDDDPEDPEMTEDDRECALCSAAPVACDDVASVLPGGSSTAGADDEKSLDGGGEGSRDGPLADEICEFENMDAAC